MDLHLNGLISHPFKQTSGRGVPFHDIILPTDTTKQSRCLPPERGEQKTTTVSLRPWGTSACDRRGEYRSNLSTPGVQGESTVVTLARQEYRLNY